MCLSETDKDVTFTSPTTPSRSVDPSYDLSMEFVRLQKLLGRVAMVNKVQGGGGSNTGDSVGSDAVFVTMLKYVMTSGQKLQSAEFDLPSQMTSLSQAMRRVTDCIEVLDNLTLGHQQLVKTLMSPWNDIPGHLLLARGNLSSHVVEGFESCRRQFASVTNSKGDTGADPMSAVDDMFRQYMNKTLETVAKLSHTVQTTLDRMKTLPEELFAENKTAIKIGHKLTEAVSKLNSKVQSGWKHVASKFEDVRKKWFGHREPKKTCKHTKSKEQKKHDKKKTGSDKYAENLFTESDGKVENKRKSYKQTKSAQRREYGPQKHVDDPSSASQLDDFFEDNQRAWRQRLRGLGGHIERLSEEVFMSMDDDDVENMVEDLKDIGGDELDKRDVTDDVRTWMSCQLRWWRSRIHRKHRAEDLMRGCGRQLVHWQLRVLCKQLQQQQRTVPLPYHHLCDAAVMTRTQHPYDVLLLFDKLPTAQDHGPTVDKVDELMLQNASCLDGGDWYFRRVQDREDRRQLSPQWYFDRVEDRQFSRGDANWYLRAMRRHADLSALPLDRHDHQRHPSDKGRD